MVLSPKAKSMSVAFLVGWIVGLVVAIVVFTLLSSVLGQGDPGAPSRTAGVIKIVLGGLLLLVAARQRRGGPPSPDWTSRRSATPLILRCPHACPAA